MAKGLKPPSNASKGRSWAQKLWCFNLKLGQKAAAPHSSDLHPAQPLKSTTTTCSDNLQHTLKNTEQQEGYTKGVLQQERQAWKVAQHSFDQIKAQFGGLQQQNQSLEECNGTLRSTVAEMAASLSALKQKFDAAKMEST